MSKQKMFCYPPIDRVPICPDVVYRGRGWEGAGKFFGTGRDGGNAEDNKRKLLEIAKDGKDRPNARTQLGHALCHYLDFKGSSYDSIFDEEIRKLRPDWFVARSEKTKKRKEKLLEMARNGEDRPIARTELGDALRRYLDFKGSSYDSIFDEEIRKLRPDWFFTRLHKTNTKKEQLLDMARNGEDRPNQKKSKLGRALCDYTNSNSKCYDAKFTSEVYKLAPHWKPKRSKR